jgi:pyrrolysine biosynthesis protein PylC
MDKKRIVVIGGKLQGIEACYLASKAGYHVTLIDKRADTPASGLADEVIVGDVAITGSASARYGNHDPLMDCLVASDMIVPAFEDDFALEAIARIADELDLPIAFSLPAYKITSSKRKSDELIRSLGLPAPRDAGASVIVKPSTGSGSVGVRRFDSDLEARDYIAGLEGEEPIIQEYLDGPSYSIEVIGCSSGHCGLDQKSPDSHAGYRTYAITQIHIDDNYDCNLVTTPCGLMPEHERSLRDSAMKLAEAVGLYGIMDVEVILSDGEMKILEIDARLPSQTPAAVLASTGVNYLEELMELVSAGKSGSLHHCTPRDDMVCASYENILVTRDHGVRSEGEHIMSASGPLTMYMMEGAAPGDVTAPPFGADEAITDWHPDCTEFRGIFINAAATEAELAEKRERMYMLLEDFPLSP